MKLQDFKIEIKKLVQEHKITVSRQKFKSSVGRAYVDEKRIKIPSIIDLYTAAVAVHEIAHVILNHPNEIDEYLVEYETEMWTIRFLKKHDMHVDYKAEFEEYVMGAKSYVESIINKQKQVNANIKVRKRVNNWLSRNI